MAIKFDLNAMFFIKPLSTDGDILIFSISLLIVFIYAALFSYCLNEYLREKYKEMLEPFFEFLNMFILMTYNFWVVLAYFVGRVTGYLIWAYLCKRMLNKSFFKNIDVC